MYYTGNKKYNSMNMLDKADISTFHYISVDMQMLKCDVQLMLDVIGSDPSEQACEDECHKIIQEGHYLNYACPLVCLG